MRRKDFYYCEGYKAYKIDKESWQDWQVIGDPCDISNFTTWAIRKAASIVLSVELSNNNNWWWSNGNFVCNSGGFYYYLGVTKNNILVLREYFADMTQASLYRIEME